MPKPVNTKADFVSRYKAGEFGNRPQTWESYADWYDWYRRLPERISFCKDKRFHMRSRIKGYGESLYNLSAFDMITTLQSGVDVHASHWYVTEMAPGELTLIQGEYYENPVPYFRWSDVKKPMRLALAERMHHTYGLAATDLIRRTMDPRSHNWFKYLLEAYPGHIIEFSVYSQRLGIEKTNTCFWEVRTY